MSGQEFESSRLRALGGLLCYDPLVRYRLFVILSVLFFFAACGKSLEKQIETQVGGLAGADLDDDITVSEIRETSDYASAEVQITTGVKMKREGSRWVLEEVRLDDRHWEKVSRITKALNQIRRDDTREMLTTISDSIRRYEETNGRVPQVDSLETLIDILNPAYLERVLRLDAWSNPFRYLAKSPSSYELRSAGEDAKFGTQDDIAVTQ